MRGAGALRWLIARSPPKIDCSQHNQHNAPNPVGPYSYVVEADATRSKRPRASGGKTATGAEAMIAQSVADILGRQSYLSLVLPELVMNRRSEPHDQ